MPEYLKRTGRDTTDDILVRVPEAEKTIARVRGPASKRPSIDRGSIPSVAAPFEGQMMIQYADQPVGATPVSADVGDTFHGEQPYYYSNGKWRPFFTGTVLSSAEEHLQVASTSCAATGTTIFSLSHYAGAALVDLSSPGVASFLAAGVYAINVGANVDLPAVEPAGDAFDIRLNVIQVSPAWPPATPTPGEGTAIASGDTFEVIEWTCSVTARVGVSDSFTLTLFNRTSYAVDFVAGISVVRIL